MSGATTLNVKLSKEQAAWVNHEVESGQYTSASEVIREALRLWMEKRIAADVAELERVHAGAWERDTTPDEEASILRLQKQVRAELLSEQKPKISKGKAGVA